MTVKIGVTGHQRLEDPQSWLWVESMINSELDRFEDQIVGVTSLAIGADQLFAHLVAKRGGAIHAIIPYPGYERSFGPEDLPAYRKLLSGAASVEILDTSGTDEDAYLAAGKRIVDLAYFLIAVWDGNPAKGKGGTADIVQYALEKGKRLIHLNPVDQIINRL